MSPNFNLYCQYHDLLYYDKDYLAEKNYIDDLIQKFLPLHKNVFELGSGTGKHALLLAEKGYQILGIKRSSEMITISESNNHGHVQFQIADVVTFKNDKRFDVPLSLFHVISYLNNNQDLIRTFQNVHYHLNKDGIFIFDIWHSPAVNAQIPEKRTKALQNENIKVVRTANPIIYTEKNIVEVNYVIEIEDLESGMKSNVAKKNAQCAILVNQK